MDEASKPETKIRKVQRSTKVNALPRLLADVGEDAAVNVEDQAVDKVGSLAYIGSSRGNAFTLVLR